MFACFKYAKRPPDVATQETRPKMAAEVAARLAEQPSFVNSSSLHHYLNNEGAQTTGEAQSSATELERVADLIQSIGLYQGTWVDKLLGTGETLHRFLHPCLVCISVLAPSGMYYTILSADGIGAESIDVGMPKYLPHNSGQSLGSMDRPFPSLPLGPYAPIPSHCSSLDHLYTTGNRADASTTSTSPSSLPTDWQLLSEAHGFTEFCAVPVRDGGMVVGAISVAAGPQRKAKPGGPPQPPVRAGWAQLPVVAAFLGSILQDEGVEVACSMLEQLDQASTIDQLVKSMAWGVGAYCKAKMCLMPQTRIALIRDDRGAAAIFDQSGRNRASALHAEREVEMLARESRHSNQSYAPSMASDDFSPFKRQSPGNVAGEMLRSHLTPAAKSRRASVVPIPLNRGSMLPLPATGARRKSALPATWLEKPQRSHHSAAQLAESLDPPGRTLSGSAVISECLSKQSRRNKIRRSSTFNDCSRAALMPHEVTMTGHPMLLSNTLLERSMQRKAGLWVTDCPLYMQDRKQPSQDIYLGRSSTNIMSVAVTTTSCRPHASRPAPCLSRRASTASNHFLVFGAQTFAPPRTASGNVLAVPSLENTQTLRSSALRTSALRSSALHACHDSEGDLPNSPHSGQIPNLPECSSLYGERSSAEGTTAASEGAAASPWLGVYVAFSTSMPPPLLIAMVNHVNTLLQVAGPLMWSKLHVDMVHEWQLLCHTILNPDTLRAKASGAPRAALVPSPFAATAKAIPAGPAVARSPPPVVPSVSVHASPCVTPRAMSRLGSMQGTSECGSEANEWKNELSFIFESQANPAAKVSPMVAALHDKLSTMQARLLHTNTRDRIDDLHCVELLEQLGTGGFGVVYRGTFQGIEVAIKVTRCGDSDAEQQGARDALELAAQTTMSHPNIVQIVTFFTDVSLVHSEKLAALKRGQAEASGSSLPSSKISGGGLARPAFGDVATNLNHVMVSEEVMVSSRDQSQEDTDTLAIVDALMEARPPTAQHQQQQRDQQQETAQQQQQQRDIQQEAAQQRQQDEQKEVMAALAALLGADVQQLPGGYSVASPTAIPASTLPAGPALQPKAASQGLDISMVGGSQVAAKVQQLVMVPTTPDVKPIATVNHAMAVCMELCDKGNLFDAIRMGAFKQYLQGGQGAWVPKYDAIFATLLEVAMATRYLHSMGLVHGDLKPSNILLRSSMRDPRGFTCKLSDFGLAKLLVEDGFGQMVIAKDGDGAGTVTHQAPELFCEGHAANSSIDIYALGIMMWEMVTTFPLYHGMRAKEIREGVRDKCLRPEFPAYIDHKEYKALAAACWDDDPLKRPTASEFMATIRQLATKANMAAISSRRCSSGPHQETFAKPAERKAFSPLGDKGSSGRSVARSRMSDATGAESRVARDGKKPAGKAPEGRSSDGRIVRFSTRTRSQSWNANADFTFPLHIL